MSIKLYHLHSHDEFPDCLDDYNKEQGNDSTWTIKTTKYHLPKQIKKQFKTDTQCTKQVFCELRIHLKFGNCLYRMKSRNAPIPETYADVYAIIDVDKLNIHDFHVITQK